MSSIRKKGQFFLQKIQYSPTQVDKKIPPMVEPKSLYINHVVNYLFYLSLIVQPAIRCVFLAYFDLKKYIFKQNSFFTTTIFMIIIFLRVVDTIYRNLNFYVFYTCSGCNLLFIVLYYQYLCQITIACLKTQRSQHKLYATVSAP